MSITFSNLPQFEIFEIKKQGSITKFSGIIKNSTLTKAKPNWVVTICINQNKFIQGRFSEVDSKTFHVVIDTVGSEASEILATGNVYSLLDGYW